MPKPAALLKPRKSWAWPGFKQQCSWDLLHFRQTALSVSLAINSPCGCLPLPRKVFFFFGSGKTHRLITVGSKASFVSAAQGQRASRCCCFNALIVAGSSRGWWWWGVVLEGDIESPQTLLDGVQMFVFVAAGVFCCLRRWRDSTSSFLCSHTHTEYQTLGDLGSSC